ncbi:MAG: DUF167 domain-containing protein [Candidatus Falkowbacteria bacterium]
MLTQFNKQLQDKGEVYLRFKVHPNASVSNVREILKDKTIKIDISATPEKNKANVELIKFLAKEFKVAKQNIVIISGRADAVKLIKIKI